MKIFEKNYNGKFVTKYEANNLNSFRSIFEFLNLIRSKKYNFSNVEFMDTDNSADDGNETFNIDINNFDYDVIEKKYNSYNISAVGIDIIIKDIILSVLVSKNYEITVISYENSRELLKKFEQDMELL